MVKIRTMLIALLILNFTCLLSAREVTVRVLSKHDLRTAVIYGSANKNNKCFLDLTTGKLRATYVGGKKETGAVKLFNGVKDVYTIEAAGLERKVPGKLTAYTLPEEKGIILVSAMDMEDYVPCVLASEMEAGQYTPELAKAFAVVIRSFAFYNTPRHKGYDFCDLTHCQSFKGVPPQKMWFTAARQIKGVVLKGACVKKAIYFSACCGGVTENAGEFLSGKKSACGPAKADVYKGVQLCAGHRYYRWTKHIHKGFFEETLAEFTDGAPQIKDMTVKDRTVSGRVKTMNFSYSLKGNHKRMTLDVNKFFSAFGKKAGWALIPSKFFEIKKSGDTFVLSGRGHGHGVGFCLQGAQALSEMGKNHREILMFYFPGFNTGGI